MGFESRWGHSFPLGAGSDYLPSGTSILHLVEIASRGVVTPKILLDKIFADPDLTINKKLIAKLFATKSAEDVLGSLPKFRNHAELRSIGAHLGYELHVQDIKTTKAGVDSMHKVMVSLRKPESKEAA